MKKFILIVGLVFAVTLAVVIGVRLSTDAMALVIGIICAVLASVPPSLMLFWVLRQREQQLESQMQLRQYGQYPPIVVVNGQGQNGLNGSQPPPTLTAPAGARNFKVIGQENTETNGSDVLPPFWDDL